MNARRLAVKYAKWAHRAMQRGRREEAVMFAQVSVAFSLLVMLEEK